MKPITSLAEKWNPSRRVVAGWQRDQSQYKSKPNRQTQNSANQTQSTEVFIKKKKKITNGLFGLKEREGE